MISAVIFDLDGTIFDNEGIWEEAFKAVVEEKCLQVKKWMGNGWLHEPGIGLLPNWEKLVGKDNPDLDELVRLSRERYLSLVGDISNLGVRSGLVLLVEQVKESGWQTALATSGEWHRVEEELEQADLYLAFDVTTTGEEVLMQKPDPEIYTLTCQKLGLEPQDCVVIEDSVSGVESAVAAGAFAVGITSDYASERDLRSAGAQLVVENLAEVMIGLPGHGHQALQHQDEKDE